MTHQLAGPAQVIARTANEILVDPHARHGALSRLFLEVILDCTSVVDSIELDDAYAAIG